MPKNMYVACSPSHLTTFMKNMTWTPHNTHAHMSTRLIDHEIALPCQQHTAPKSPVHACDIRMHCERHSEGQMDPCHVPGNAGHTEYRLEAYHDSHVSRGATQG